MCVASMYSTRSWIDFEPQWSTSRGTGFPNRKQRYSTLLRDIAKSDLKRRCSRRLSRRMSIMNAMSGRIIAMYEKF